jgi:hypothetical protein
MSSVQTSARAFVLDLVESERPKGGAGGSSALVGLARVPKSSNVNDKRQLPSGGGDAEGLGRGRQLDFFV